MHILLGVSSKKVLESLWIQEAKLGVSGERRKTETKLKSFPRNINLSCTRSHFIAFLLSLSSFLFRSSAEKKKKKMILIKQVFVSGYQGPHLEKHYTVKTVSFELISERRGSISNCRNQLRPSKRSQFRIRLERNKLPFHVALRSF